MWVHNVVPVEVVNEQATDDEKRLFKLLKSAFIDARYNMVNPLSPKKN